MSGKNGGAAADPRYPVGTFEWKGGGNTSAERRKHIAMLAAAPANMRAAVKGLSKRQLDTPDREGGWTVRQVVHHVPDSHLNAYVRFKLALTEDAPAIKPYMEARWAELGDTRITDIQTSLDMLEVLHRRWVNLLKSMRPEDFARCYRHPEMGVVSLDQALAMYAHHSLHHCAHITGLRKKMGWGRRKK